MMMMMMMMMIMMMMMMMMMSVVVMVMMILMMTAHRLHEEAAEQERHAADAEGHEHSLQGWERVRARGEDAAEEGVVVDHPGEDARPELVLRLREAEGVCGTRRWIEIIVILQHVIDLPETTGIVFLTEPLYCRFVIYHVAGAGDQKLSGKAARSSTSSSSSSSSSSLSSS
jgi:hypothetical protein